MRRAYIWVSATLLVAHGLVIAFQVGRWTREPAV